MKNLPVSKIEIEMVYKGEDKLITENQVHALLIKKYGDLTKYKRKEFFSELGGQFLSYSFLFFIFMV